MPADVSLKAGKATRVAALYAHALERMLEMYDSERHLVWQPSAERPEQRTYRQAASLPLAEALLRSGRSEDIAEATAIIQAVLASQELATCHPHRGNWLWLADDQEVVDLNAVQFVLRGLLPLLLRHESLLPDDLVRQCREQVLVALQEEERLDVASTYTNIHLMSLLALLLGGQWLGDPHFQQLGRERWARWVHFTVRNGAPHEYNSPGYGGVDLSVLAELAILLDDPAIRLQARVLYERLWLHLALHLHRPTRQLAGPHCRCYWDALMSGQGPVKDVLWRETGWAWLLEPGPYGGRPATELPTSLELALTDHWLPRYLQVWLAAQEKVMPYMVGEMANAGDGSDLTTYCTPAYALGTASRTYTIGQECFYIEHQANYLLLYYRNRSRPGGWDMMYSRYVVNDRHWGTLAAAPDRSQKANFYDQGNFAGVQWANKAIALYALLPQHEQVHSLKTVVVFPALEALDRIWAGNRTVALSELPYALQVGDWLIVESGPVYIGVRPLEPSCLGYQAPTLLERGPLGELWLTIYNYRGPAKRFWEYASLHGAFWRGNLKAGYIVEVAERDAYESALAFLQHLQRATIVDKVDGAMVRTITYASGGDEVALCYDLWNTRPLERKINGSTYRSPSLLSPLAVQGDSGELRVGRARLQANRQPLWLVAQELDLAERCWVVVNPEDRPTPLRLETPCGIVAVEGFGLGRLEWDAPLGGEQRLYIESIAPVLGLRVPDGVTVRFERPPSAA